MKNVFDDLWTFIPGKVIIWWIEKLSNNPIFKTKFSGKMNAHHVDVHQPGHFPCPGEKCGKVIIKIDFLNLKKISFLLNVWKMFIFPLRCSPARINKPPTTQSKNSSQDKILTSLTINYDHHSDLWWSSYCVKIITLSHNHQHAVFRWSSYSIKRSILKLLTAPNSLNLSLNFYVFRW